MSDLVQEDLRAWARGDRSRGDAVITALTREWRPRVARFLQAPSPDEVEEVLQEALVALALSHQGRPPRALAPDDAPHPAAWRRTVLQRHLVDRSRYRGRRRHAEQGEALGLSPRAEAERWRARKAGLSLVSEVASPPPAQDERALDLTELALRRRDALRVLPGLPVRRRALLLLALGGDPTPFAGELAQDLRCDPVALLGRLSAALDPPPTDDPPTPDQIRVIWPDPPLKTEAARKTLERAVADLRALLEAAR